MSNIIRITKRTETAILNNLLKGNSLREIGNKFGISHQKVWRVGHNNGIYSSRSICNN